MNNYHFRKADLLNKICYYWLNCVAFKKQPMGFKSPTEPIIISQKDADWLERKLEENNKRTRLTAIEKVLLEDSRQWDNS